MRALVIHAPLDLRIESQEVSSPGPDQVAVNIRAGGVCGSDLHYYKNGGFGAIRLKQPMIPGHEVAGEIAAIGGNVTGLSVGEPVTINPSLPCLDCQYCRREEFNQCLDMRFYGSAMRFPHVQGAFCEHLICEARQCVSLTKNTDLHHAAFAEPLAVALHAVNRAANACGGLAGKRVFVSGCGPIGLLTLMAARHAGAMEVVAADVSDFVLNTAQKVGASDTINVLTNAKHLQDYQKDKGYFDVAFEASGIEAAVHSAIAVLKPGGILTQLGLGGDITLPMNLCVAKEIQMLGSFRFHQEFEWAAKLICTGEIDVSPLLSARISMENALSAFELAGDRSQAIKVQIAFGAA
ncbi:MAG: alcohol dehydrogenase catalytic domain-containing protein [Gammaproteobacteria bacterium]|nr:alcohol dehydrogenase catalytic domain-containing protein [Gammaproteobacteria bacterium]